ncbi:piggyBac transposable element-derived protein 3-like [Anneissia japonica]|uniref:piggyBac transposable element-derived protein 3-like n=1 Tax=Anneissia japonica TaxID=1529436 RepID=UPI0014259435|nr:piggyBac transposable element-derived protein 3-like [Anneissia japonica]
MNALKVIPLFSSLNKNFALLYKLDKSQSIDVLSTILFKGRSCLKQYNSMKPIKMGYKLWCRADNLGYIGQFIVYQGKGSDGVLETVYPESYGQGDKVIHDLTRPLVGKGYNVYFDNYFASVPLLENIKDDGILACGTIRSNHKYLPIRTDNLKNRGNLITERVEMA